MSFIVLTLFLSTTIHNALLVAASAVAHPAAAARIRRGVQPSAAASATRVVTETSASSATAVMEAPIEEALAPNAGASTSGEVAAAPPSTSNPVAQLATYVRSTVVNFKNGLVQMNTDHRRCNAIREKQRAFAKANGTTRPRGIKGIQTGGIDFEEYDFLGKGLTDRNKLFLVGVVSVCLPNYFVYYLWSFPDMMPTPFLKVKDQEEISRERCHAVLMTLLDIEKGARVAPWSAKLNPFGRKATERAMERLGGLITLGCDSLAENGATGPNGGRMILQKLRPQLYTSEPPTKQQRLLTGKIVPRQIMKGVTKAIGADPLNKGASPFGIGTTKHVETVALADEFLVDQNVDIASINSALIAEACSARLIGGPRWSEAERQKGLAAWLEDTVIAPREATKDGTLHYNGNLARAALMCYNAVDGARDARADSKLLRVLYQGQEKAPLAVN